MIILLAKYLVKYYSSLSVFFYLTFRAIVSLLTALSISLLAGPNIIFRLQKFSFSQIVRNCGPKSHLSKKGTPTMGGIIILISTIISILLWTCLSNLYVWYVLIILIGYGIVGFIDDYYKIIYKNTRGLIASWKYFWMSAIALCVIFILYVINRDTITTTVVIPIFQNTTIQLGIFYVPLAYLVIVGTGNAVNLTDGLDGLAIIPIVLIASAFSLIALISNNVNFAGYLHIPYLQYIGELVVVCTSIIGAGLGFLWFNAHPAQIFMGDIGSLALGGTLGMIAVLLCQEWLLAIMGGVFIIETLSVILQIVSFKLYGRRIFRMTPIHHHYELKGYPESRIVVRFWIISLILVFIGLATLKVS